MQPLIKDGDYLTVRPVNHLKIGDIVLYSSPPDKLIVHRINKIRGGFIITKGDSVFWQDSPVRREDILGKVIIIERRNRRIDLEKGIWKWINLIWARIHPLFLLFRAVMRSLISFNEKENEK